MMEVVDELMTPGCPNCAKKHLSAAVERVVDGIRASERKDGDIAVILARAYINFTEAAEGYLSHRDYAVGLLVSAEEKLIRRDEFEEAKAIRGIRTGIMDGTDSLETLYFECVDRLAVAHVHEAFRELPALSEKFNRNDFGNCDQATVDWLVSMIKWVDENYFETKANEEKGDDTMACGKAKKTAPKTAKAACKGGKCGGKKRCK